MVLAEVRDFRPEGNRPRARFRPELVRPLLVYTMQIHDADMAAPPSVLVVDDEPQVVWVLQFSLEAEGYTTYAANNGVEALAEITEHRPNLMVLDIMMPTMDGWSVLEEMVKLPREERPRVVIVSALSSVRDRAKAAELGADAYVPKPFNVDELLAVLHGLERAS